MNMINTTTNARTLIEVITERQVAQNLTDEVLGTAVGFERPSIMSMIKTGAIRFPLNKIPALAQALELDAANLLVIAIKESAPDLLDLMEEVWGPRDLTPEERRLVQACRKIAAGRKMAPIIFGESGQQSVIALVTV